MLDDQESKELDELTAPLNRRIQGTADQSPELDRLIDERDAEAMRLFAQYTGHVPKEPYEVLHHRANLYGPPCGQCGKPLRTSKASRCFECGWKVGTPVGKIRTVRASNQPEVQTDEPQVRVSEFSRRSLFGTRYGLTLSLSLYHSADLQSKAVAVSTTLAEWVATRKRNAKQAVITVAGDARLFKAFADQLRVDKLKSPVLRQVKCSVSMVGGDASSQMEI